MEKMKANTKPEGTLDVLSKHTREQKQVQNINKSNPKVISHLWSLHRKRPIPILVT